MDKVNIKRFIEARKNLGLSQTELCAGICTQATLSKFEHYGKAPAIKVVIQLCRRLGLTLDEIFPTEPVTKSNESKKLAQAEFALITSEYQAAQSELTTIDFSSLGQEEQMQYAFVQGYVNALGDQPIKDALHFFDLILNDLDSNHQTIFSLLAFTGSGIAYSRQQDLHQAEYFFQKVFDQLENLALSDTTTIWRVLNMIFYTADYFGSIGDYIVSDPLLDYGYQICAQNHLTYYLARILFRKAKNLSAQKGAKEEVARLLNDALAFARLNNNQILIRKISQRAEQTE